MSRVKLEDVRSLTFYKDEQTTARRGRPILQLKCVGKLCRLYAPDVVRCVNAGGSGSEVDWKCETDLAEALRLGRTDVSCEGWSGPGDPYVLKGSCGLEYRLVEVPKGLRNQDKTDQYYVPTQAKIARWFNADTAGTTLYMILWIGVLVWIVWGFLRSCIRRSANGSRRVGGDRARPWFGGNGGGGGFGSGGGRPDPPPPYSRHDPSKSQSQNSGEGWRPGFWSGALAGGLAANLFNRRPQNQDQPRRAPPRVREYDWERRGGSLFDDDSSSSRGFRGRERDDRGEGSSMGGVRRSTGFGGTSVR